MNKIKRNNKNIIFIIILICLLIGAIITVFSMRNRNLVYKESISIKIGEEVPTINDYVSIEEQEKLDSKKIFWEDLNSEDNKIYSAGEYIGYITFKDDKLKIKLVVIDDMAPTIEGAQDITIYVNDSINLLDNITTTDNSHDELSVKVIGEYDITKVGEYNLSYSVTDKSGNEAISEFKLTIKEKEVPKSPSNSVTENVVVGTTSKGYTIKRINGIYYVNGILIANKTYALPSDYNPGGLLDTFMTSFNSMKSDAVSQGISLSIISGFRSYSTQSSLYNRYVARDGKVAADTYSARAGHSEHQTGLAADINSLDQSWINTIEGQWLNNNCYKYGFIIRYPQGKESITGYMYEPWHIRYVGVEVATALYNNGNWLTLEEYLGITSNYAY